jgi:hypothetical protein
MNDRIQRALDDDLSRDDLSPGEAAEFDELSGLFASLARAAAPRELEPQGSAVLRRIQETRASASPRAISPAEGRTLPRALAWLWAPARVSLSLRPAYALGVLLLFATGALLTSRGGAVDSGRRVSSGTAVQPVLVQFRFEAPHASAVSLAGDFTNWAPTYALQRSATGTWSIVVPLAPGVHDYSFVVDGQTWTPDPSAPARADGFGGVDSRIAVLASDAVKSL